MAYRCPVCGYPSLNEAPHARDGGGSYEMCPSCGFQFGVDDDDRGHTYARWRAEWVKGGMRWSSRGLKPPPDWQPSRYLTSLARAPTRTRRKTAKRKTVKRV